MTKAKKTFSLYSISEARNVLFGIATLWIGLFHSDEWISGGKSMTLSLEPYTNNQFLIDAFRFFRGTGNIGVDMFLLLSGIGLFFSFTKDRHVVSFWKKRLQRVLPTAILIAACYFSIRYIIGKYNPSMRNYMTRMSFTHFFFYGERVFWFISLILVLYLVFPIFYKIIEKFRWKGMLGLIVLEVAGTFALRAIAPGVYTNIEIALCRVPVFIIGIWMGKFVMEKKEIDIRWLWLFLAAAIGLSVYLYYYNYTTVFTGIIPGYKVGEKPMYIWSYRYPGSLLSIALVVLDSYVITWLRRRGRCNVLRNFFEFVGMYSMEFYMIYLNLLHFLGTRYEVSQKRAVMLCFGCFVISMVLCIIARKICDYFMEYMQRKPKGLIQPAEGVASTKWYDFLIYEGLILFAVGVLFASIAAFAGGSSRIGAACLAAGVLAIVTRILLRKRMFFATILSHFVIASVPAIWLLHKLIGGNWLAVMRDGGKKVIVLTALIIVLTLAAVAANTIYFKKRRDLFEK